MLQQCELRVMGNKSKRPSRVYLGAKVVRVKGVHLCIEGAIEVANWEIISPHLWRNCISLVIFLNVSEVAYGATTGSKKFLILKAAVKVAHFHGDDSPLVSIKVVKSAINICFDASTSMAGASNLALNRDTCRVSIVVSHCWQTSQVAYMNFTCNCHRPVNIPRCLNTMKGPKRSQARLSQHHSTTYEAMVDRFGHLKTTTTRGKTSTASTHSSSHSSATRFFSPKTNNHNS